MCSQTYLALYIDPRFIECRHEAVQSSEELVGGEVWVLPKVLQHLGKFLICTARATHVQANGSEWDAMVHTVYRPRRYQLNQLKVSACRRRALDSEDQNQARFNTHHKQRANMQVYTMKLKLKLFCRLSSLSSCCQGVVWRHPDRSQLLS